jgi:hypothetical protein
VVPLPLVRHAQRVECAVSAAVELRTREAQRIQNLSILRIVSGWPIA